MGSPAFRRRRAQCPLPCGGARELGPAALLEAEGEAGGDENDHQALDAVDDGRGHADRALHDVGAAPQAAEEERRQDRIERVTARQEGDDDAVIAVAGAEHVEQPVFQAQHLVSAGKPGERAARHQRPHDVLAHGHAGVARRLRIAADGVDGEADRRALEHEIHQHRQRDSDHDAEMGVGARQDMRQPEFLADFGGVGIGRPLVHHRPAHGIADQVDADIVHQQRDDDLVDVVPGLEIGGNERPQGRRRSCRRGNRR